MTKKITERAQALWHRFVPNREAREGILYIFFGGLTTLVNWVVYFSFVRLMGGSSPTPLVTNISNALAWVLSVLFAYVTNKKYVFRGGRGGLRELALFFSARVSSYLIFDLLFFNLFTVVFRLPHGAVKIMANVLVVAYNYFASKFVVFKGK